MPELPEMENYRRLLTGHITGKTVTDVRINREKSINLPPTDFTSFVTGRSIGTVRRRAKYLLFPLGDGRLLLLHLMLGGSLYLGIDADKPERSAQIELDFSGGTLYFLGLRLGFLHLHTETEAASRLSALGVETDSPDFTEPVLASVLRRRRGILKSLLVNQQALAGIGNCYSDEICHAAGLLPNRKARDLDGREIKALYRSIREVLTEATAQGGYMEHPLFQGDRLTGGYLCRVYDRREESCPRCGTPIQFTELNGRKCFYCPACQH